MDYPGHVVVKFTYNAKRPQATLKGFTLINEYTLQTVHSNKPQHYNTRCLLYRVEVLSISTIINLLASLNNLVTKNIIVVAYINPNNILLQ